MIFARSLQRELAYTAGAIFTVLLTLVLVSMVIRIVGLAATGDIDPRDVFVVIGLMTIGYLPVMLVVTLFVSILFVLTRWYRDSEMVMWFSAGVSLTQFIKPVAIFAAPIIALITFSAFFSWPWSHQKSKQIFESFAQRDQISMLTSGQFRESANNHQVFFVESLLPKTMEVRNVFVANTENGKVSVVVSSRGHLKTDAEGSRFVILENGRRYDGLPGQLDYRIMEFERYGVRIESRQLAKTPTTTGTSTLDLIRNPNPINLGELAWRIGLPLVALNLMLLAIPLAYQNPRRSRAVNLVMAVLIYFTYSNLLNLMQAWIEQKKLSFSVGVWLLHLLVSAGVGLFFWQRCRNRPLFEGLVSRFSFARKG